MNDSRDNNCKDMKELLSAYRDAELDAGEHRQVEEHLGTCSDCRNELAIVESVVKSLKSLPPVALSKDFADDIESIIKRSQREQAADRQGEKVVPFERKTERKSGKAVWIAAAAAASVVLMVAAYFGTTGGGAPTVATDSDTGSDVVKPDSGSKVQVAENTAAGRNDTAQIQKSDSLPSENGVVKEAPIKVATVPKQGPTLVQSQAKETPKVPGPSQQYRVRRNVDLYVDDLADNEALLALSDTYDENDIFDTGISTDEDGLYAIKM